MTTVVVDEFLIWMLFGSFVVAAVVAAIFGVLCIVFVLFTPARVWLQAKTKHVPIIAARRRDRKIDYHLAKSYEQGIVTSDRYGAFIVDEDSVYSSSKGGVSILPVNSEIGITLSPKILNLIEALKRSGFSNIEEAEQANMLHGRCECTYEGFMNFEKNKDGTPAFQGDNTLKLICPYHGQNEVKEDVKNVQETEEESGTGSSPDGDDGRGISFIADS